MDRYVEAYFWPSELMAWLAAIVICLQWQTVHHFSAIQSYLSIYLSIYLLIYLSINLFIYLSIYLSIHGFYSYIFESISINLSVHLFLYLSPRLTRLPPMPHDKCIFDRSKPKFRHRKKMKPKEKDTLMHIQNYFCVYVCMYG